MGEQLLLELLLRLGVQEPLSEGDVGEHRGERSAQFNRRLGAFLKKSKSSISYMIYVIYVSSIPVISL